MATGSPLDGIRVIELGSFITAPLAGMMLADLGADVIKVERPDGGDPFRSFRGGHYSPHFTAYNRNKRSMLLDMQTPDGLDLARTLIDRADVLLENFRPGVLERLGLDPDELAARNPRLIHATITGFGPDGPYADRPSYDSIGMALSGAASLFVDGDDFQIRGPTFTDNVTGMYSGYGILAALMRRERTGKGGRVEVTMLEASIAFIPDVFANHLQSKDDAVPYRRVSASQSYAVRCADGKLLAIHLSSPEKFWRGLVTALEHPELGTDPQFSTRMDRVKNYDLLQELLAREFLRRDRNDWISRLEKHDVPHAPIHSISEVFGDPQVQHLGTFHEMTHPGMGKLKAIHNPVVLDGKRQATRYAPPTLGEHTEAILTELGLDEAAHRRLRESGAIGS